mgnify:CR=1 FL=1
MKFTCSTSDLLQAIQLTSRAISSQQALPILGNILFEVKGTSCTLSATDLELSIVTSFDASIEREGSITIPAKAIQNFAQYNQDSEVTLEVLEGNQLKCTSKHSKTALSGESAKEYPTIPSVDGKTTFSIEAAPFLEALRLVTFTSAKTSLRPVLSGVSLRTEGDSMILVATDSYRLSEYKLATSVTGELGCIIPVKVLEELKVALASAKGGKEKPDDGEEKKEKEPAMIDVTLSPQQIELKTGRTRLLSRLIEGKFPDYRQIIPKQTNVTAFISSRDLTVAAKRMHYFAKEVNNNITFKFGSGQAELATPQTQLGKDEATISAEVEGGEAKIALSSSYLLDFLSHVEGEQLKVSIMDAMHPAVFHLPGNERFLHLIMPLRLQDNA